MNNENLKPFVKGDDPRRNITGRPEGSKSRATIARKVLEMNALLPENIFETLQQIYPEISDKMTAEEIATIVMIGNAISKGDVNAYKAVMDSAYGAPKQDIEQSGSLAINWNETKTYASDDKTDTGD